VVASTHPHLFCTRDGAEDDLAKLSVVKWSISDSSNDLVAFLDDGDAPVVPVKDETGNVFSRHLG